MLGFSGFLGLGGRVSGFRVYQGFRGLRDRSTSGPWGPFEGYCNREPLRGDLKRMGVLGGS